MRFTARFDHKPLQKVNLGTRGNRFLLQLILTKHISNKMFEIAISIACQKVEKIPRENGLYNLFIYFYLLAKMKQQLYSSEPPPN